VRPSGGAGWIVGCSQRVLSADGLYETSDVRVIKLDPVGYVQWDRTFGRLYPVPYTSWSNEAVVDLLNTSEGGWMVVGGAVSFGFDQFIDGVWLLELGPSGALDWQATYEGGAINTWPTSAADAGDGGWAIAGDQLGTGVGSILKVGPNGEVQWRKLYGDGDPAAGSFRGLSLAAASDGGFALAGRAIEGGGSWDFWLARLSPPGDVIWQKRYGGAHSEQAQCLAGTNGGGWSLAGLTSTWPATGSLWMVNADPDGSVEFSGGSGGYAVDAQAAVIPTGVTVASYEVQAAESSAIPFTTGVDVVATAAVVTSQAP
jgi:hypothetical protein